MILSLVLALAATASAATSDFTSTASATTTNKVITVVQPTGTGIPGTTITASNTISDYNSYLSSMPTPSVCSAALSIRAACQTYLFAPSETVIISDKPNTDYSSCLCLRGPDVDTDKEFKKCYEAYKVLAATNTELPVQIEKDGWMMSQDECKKAGYSSYTSSPEPTERAVAQAMASGNATVTNPPPPAKTAGGSRIAPGTHFVALVGTTLVFAGMMLSFL